MSAGGRVFYGNKGTLLQGHKKEHVLLLEIGRNSGAFQTVLLVLP